MSVDCDEVLVCPECGRLMRHPEGPFTFERERADTIALWPGILLLVALSALILTVVF